MLEAKIKEKMVGMVKFGGAAGSAAQSLSAPAKQLAAMQIVFPLKGLQVGNRGGKFEDLESAHFVGPGLWHVEPEGNSSLQVCLSLGFRDSRA